MANPITDRLLQWFDFRMGSENFKSAAQFLEFYKLPKDAIANLKKGTVPRLDTVIEYLTKTGASQEQALFILGLEKTRQNSIEFHALEILRLTRLNRLNCQNQGTTMAATTINESEQAILHDAISQKCNELGITSIPKAATEALYASTGIWVSEEILGQLLLASPMGNLVIQPEELEALLRWLNLDLSFRNKITSNQARN